MKQNIRQHLCDAEHHKFIPHIYLKDSPFSAKFDENKIYYHGGTAVAIQAGLLSEEEIREANQRMLENMKRAHAQTIGLTLYPTYPAGSFKGVGMYPYGYQNGGDWTWFGARILGGTLPADALCDLLALRDVCGCGDAHTGWPGGYGDANDHDPLCRRTEVEPERRGSDAPNRLEAISGAFPTHGSSDREGGHQLRQRAPHPAGLDDRGGSITRFSRLTVSFELARWIP